MYKHVSASATVALPLSYCFLFCLFLFVFNSLFNNQSNDWYLRRGDAINRTDILGSHYYTVLYNTISYTAQRLQRNNVEHRAYLELTNDTRYHTSNVVCCEYLEKRIIMLYSDRIVLVSNIFLSTTATLCDQCSTLVRV